MVLCKQQKRSQSLDKSTLISTVLPGRFTAPFLATFGLTLHLCNMTNGLRIALVLLLLPSALKAQEEGEEIKIQLDLSFDLANQSFDAGMAKYDSLEQCCLMVENEEIFRLKQLDLAVLSHNISKYEVSAKLSTECMDFFKAASNHRKYIDARVCLAQNLLFMGEGDSAEWLLKDCLNQIPDMNMENQRILSFRCKSSLGIKYAMNQEVPPAIQYFKSCDSLAVLLKNKSWEANVAGYMGNVYQMIGQIEEAQTYFQKSFDALVEDENFRMALVTADNMANLYVSTEEYDKSLSILKAGRKYGRTAGDSIGLASNYDITSSILIYKDSFTKAKTWLDRAYEIQNGQGNTYALLQLKIRYTEYYQYISDFATMNESAREALKMAIEIGDNYYRLRALKSLYRSYQLLGQLDEAYQYQSLYYELNDSINQAKYSEETAQLQAEYNNASQKREIERLNTAQALADEKQRREELANNFLLAGIAISLIALALLGYLINNLRKSKGQTELQKADLEKSDREKALLLKELHHRVKNNLQIVSSLLNLQGDSVKDEQAQIAFREGQNRVDAMAMIHRHLYSTDELTSIDINGYLERLINSLAYSYGFNKSSFQLKLEVVKSPIDVDVAIPLGLIVNELVSNSFKHAFKQTEMAELKVSLQTHEDNIRLEVSDNGPGLPADFGSDNTTSFGLELVQTLVHQLKGDIHFMNQHGTHISIEIHPSQALAA